MGLCIKNKFEDDLAFGEQAEARVLKLVKRKYPKATRMKGKFSEFDIFIPELSEGIEVKFDRKSEATGNVFIEVMMYGKPSGLSLTRAFLWAYVVGKEVLYVAPMQIANCIRKHGIPLREGLGDGQGFAYIIAVDLFKDYCK